MNDHDRDARSIADLIDRRQVEDVLNLYCRAIDRCDEPLLDTLFHADAMIDHPPLPDDAAGFCREVMRLVRSTGPSLHSMTNVSIELAGATAYTEAYFSAWHRVEAGDDSGVFNSRSDIDEYAVMGGRYINWLSKRDGDWKISHHSTIVEWESWVPADERSHLVAIGRTKSRRDVRDPSYARDRFPGGPGGA
ncbi:MAG: nuclear transport factor 2 family protein [Sphingobium sp.]|nr:nuclear transport factor 2 family protein [Sphingobium sp.]